MRAAISITTRVITMLVVVSTCGCAKLMQDMYDQPKDEPLEASPLFANGLSSRTPLPGTIAQSAGAFADSSSGAEGPSKIIGVSDAEAVFPVGAQGRIEARLPPTAERTEVPFPVTLQVLRRGRERFNVYCSPCHSRTGDGDGMVVRSGFPRPPSYHTNALRRVPLGHFYDVITHGYGVMYSYASRVSPHDRWAIAAYIRALQLSRHARLRDVPASRRGELEQARR